MSFNIILGNFFALIGVIFILISVVKRNKKDLIWWQTINVLFCILASIAFCAYSALITNCFSMVRNILVYKNKLTLKSTLWLSLLCCIIGILVNNLGIIGLLAVTASVSYTILMYTTKNAQQMRFAVLLNSILWLIHDFYVQSYPTVLTGIMFIIWTVIQIVKNRKRSHKKALKT